MATGHLNHRPYVVAEYIEPQEDQDLDESWRWLGRYTTIVSTVPLYEAPQEVFSRFGRDLPLAWQAHLNYNLHALSEADPLIAEGIYQPASSAACARSSSISRPSTSPSVWPTVTWLLVT